MSTEHKVSVVYEGQLPSTKTALYTVPEDAVAYIKQISIFNTNATAETILVYVKPGATSRLWRRYVLALNESAELLDQNQVLLLEEGDQIEAETTTADKVDCFITAVVED